MVGNYYKTKETVEEYIKLAKGVNGGDLIEKLNQVLPKGSKVLELGSGPGSDWAILNNLYNVTGSDYSNVFLEHLKSEFPDGKFLQLDASILNVNAEFDAIYSNKVLHHLTDKELFASIKRQYELLKKGRVVCHSFWKGAGEEIFKGLFVNYHTLEELQTFFERYFQIDTLVTYKEFENDDSIFLIARKK